MKCTTHTFYTLCNAPNFPMRNILLNTSEMKMTKMATLKGFAYFSMPAEFQEARGIFQGRRKWETLLDKPVFANFCAGWPGRNG